MKIKRYSVINLLTCVGYIILLCNNVNTSITWLQYGDELLTIVFVIYILLHSRHINDFNLLLVHFIFILTGIIGTILWNKQIAPAIMQDILVCSKYIIAYIFAKTYFRFHAKSIKSIFLVSKIIIWLVFSLSIINWFMPSLFNTDQDFIQVGQKVIFTHQTYLTSFGVIFLLVFSIYYYIYKHGAIYLIQASYLILVSMTTKGLAFLIVYWVLYLCIFKLRIRNLKILVVICACGLLLMSYSALFEYFGDSNHYSPRNIMLTDSIRILVEYFPFGIGLAAYGSSVAYRYYSPMYVALGYQNNFGMNLKDEVNYMCDNFWPCIFGEYGFCGTILFLAIIVMFVKMCINQYKLNKHLGYISFAAIVYLLITSTAETSFFGINGVIFMLLLGMLQVIRKDYCNN